MSELRKKLESVKGKYLSAKYPGDLAADVLGRQSRGWGWQIIGAIALAAAVTIALLVLTSSDSTTESPIAVNTPPTTSSTPIAEAVAEMDFSIGMIPPVSFTEVVNNAEIVPPSYDTGFFVPSVSFFGTYEETENESTS